MCIPGVKLQGNRRMLYQTALPLPVAVGSTKLKGMALLDQVQKDMVAADEGSRRSAPRRASRMDQRRRLRNTKSTP